MNATRDLAVLRARLPGGTDGNERLTVLAGALLFVLLAVLGVTIVFIGQLMWLHLFLGLAVAGPVVLKLASTGYRFALYYIGDPAYRRKGPPLTPLRLLAPLLVLSTAGVIATGVVLLALGPQSRQPVGMLHKLFFFAWLATCAIHVLGHVPEMMDAGDSLLKTRRDTLALAAAPREVTLPGAAVRTIAIVVSSAAGVALALALTGLFPPWTR